MRAGVLLLVAALGLSLAPVRGIQPVAHAPRMSFSNRQLLNRAVVSGLRSIDVMLLVKEGHAAPDVASLGGRISRAEKAIGYVRADIPIERLLDLVRSPAVEAYQIASLSRGSWYRDGPPMRNAITSRSAEVTPVNVAAPPVARPDLPMLSVEESRAPGFTADDAGVGAWLEAHPTFDGRGVTIALVENALPSFLDPTIGTAKTLDGRDVSKIAGILNSVGAGARDVTRVSLDTIVRAATTWARVGARTYILPRPGAFRFGVYEVAGGANVVQRFGVIEDMTSHEVYLDGNGDGSFQDEKALADVNERFEPRTLMLRHPSEGAAAFVMGRGAQPHTVHVYLARGSHQTMTLSVAAGSRTDRSLAVGVAPNARVLLVDIASPDPALAALFEGFFEAARRPDVDVICTSWGMLLIPDTDADFSGAFFTRLANTYKKPIVNSAGNRGPLVGSADGSMLSVGGHLSPATWAALYGGRPLGSTIVHPMSAAGPSLDGAIKPDVLAPMERIAADLPWNADFNVTPVHAPARRIPAGYQIACCTSATSPYAAGVAALLISAAKQTGVQYDGERLSDAMRFSSRLMPGVAAHRQGHGSLDINAAWQALSHPLERPRITATAAIVHPLAQYAARGPEGQGILEVEGWTPGMTGTRQITFTRHSGPAATQTYRLAWTASDGSFTTPSSVDLPLRQPVAVQIGIDMRTPGVHSGLLELRDRTGAPIFRTQATVIAAQTVDPATQSLRETAALENLAHRSHYVHVPPGTTALTFELQVIRGVVQPTIVPSHGLFPSYYLHAYPMNVFHSGKGTYVVRLPDPEPGTWTFQVETNSRALIIPGSPVPSDDGDAQYTLTVRLQDSSSEPSGSIVDAKPGFLISHHARFNANGMPNLFDIDVAPQASTLSLAVRAQGDGPKTELHLYDCTTGECFSYNIGFPAARAHTLAVRKPNAGRWVAAVNAAPFPAASGSFVLDELLTFAGPPPAVGRGTPVMVTELIDTAAERAEIDHPWSTAPNYVKLRDRPIAIRRTIQPR